MPGTDENIWILVGAGGATALVITWLAAQSEGTYFHGGAYTSDNANARNVFVGCYRESGQGLNQVKSPSIILGGLMDNNRASGLSMVGNEVIGIPRYSNDETHFETQTRAMDMRINGALNNMIDALVTGDHASGLRWLAWDETNKHYMVQHAASTARQMIAITSDLNTLKFGRASALDGGELLFLNGFFLGQGSGARWMANGTAAPTSGSEEHAVGEIVWNSAGGAGAVVGWKCTAAGTPGTWVEMRCLADQTADADQAALTNSTGGTGDGTLSAITAGGAGTAAGAWDTAANRDAAIGIIEDNFTELHLLVDQIRTALVGNGIMKGSV